MQSKLVAWLLNKTNK